MTLSLIIPVYNRPGELRELLCSLAVQSDPDFEVVVVEDGSSRPGDEVVGEFDGRLKLNYLVKPNSGPGLSRNEGAAVATGDWLVFLDSDCVVPEGYVAAVKNGIVRTGCEIFGGPDRASADFSPMQKAVSYSMTSFFTTGGIRGGGERMDKFHPRSFNMGISRKAFQAVGGFSGMRYGEDIDLSIRLIQSGFRSVLLKEAWVYHKRRTDLCAFFRQVFHSGEVRIVLERRHPHTLKAVHALPALFTLASFFLTLSFVCCLMEAVAFASSAWLIASLSSIAPLLLYALLVFSDSLFRNGFGVARLSVLTSFVQLWGYGSGFLKELAFPARKTRY